MKIKRLIGFALFLISLGLVLFGNFSFTGEVIGFQNKFNILNFLGILILFISLILLTSKKSLEAIVIPTGQEDIERAETGRRYQTKEDQYFIISGGKGAGSLSESERAHIYRELRQTKALKEFGKEPKIKPSQITIEESSTDTLENVLKTLKKLRPGTERITFVSYPLHLERFKLIMKKAREGGLVPEGLKEKYIPTEQNLYQFIYGKAALAKEKIRLRNGIKNS